MDLDTTSNTLHGDECEQANAAMAVDGDLSSVAELSETGRDGDSRSMVTHPSLIVRSRWKPGMETEMVNPLCALESGTNDTAAASGGTER